MIIRDPELDEVIRIAREAAEVVRGVYATELTVEEKGIHDPVTRADREADALIGALLVSAFPGEAIISEESVPESLEEVARRVSEPRVWFVDPLDGTREFTQRIPEYAVMIGLAVEGRAELGVVVMPATGELVAGRVGGAAFAEDAAGARRAIHVSAVSDPRQATVVTSRSHRPPLLDPLIEQLGVEKIVPCGSVGVKVARIVLGQADLYVHDGGGAKRWDSCAPEAVLRAAGGRFTDLEGNDVDYASAVLLLESGIIAGNEAMHDAALAAVARQRAGLPEPPKKAAGF